MSYKNGLILVVDDHAVVRQIVSSFLKKLGYKHVNLAEDGRDALRQLKRKKYDVIICDWHMPNMSGLELLTKMKEDAELKDIPFVMLTMETDKEQIVSAIQLGVNDYILKSFTQNILDQEIGPLLKKMQK